MEAEEIRALSPEEQQHTLTVCASGSENWIDRGIHVADVLGYLHIPSQIDLPDDEPDFLGLRDEAPAFAVAGKPFTPQQEKCYVANMGMWCPYCGSDQVESDAIDADGIMGYANVRCLKCGAEWNDQWSLDKPEANEEPGEPEQDEKKESTP
jgi:hypothetical protein